MRKIVGIGETVLDIVFKEEKPVAAVPGGSTFNAMISLGRTLGQDARALMVTDIGDDHVGDIVTTFLKDNNVSTEAVIRRKNSQSRISLAFLDKNNNASYEFFKERTDPSLFEDKLKSLDFEKNDFLLFGSFFAIDPRLRPFVTSLLAKARAAGAIIYYDINFRKNHIADLPWAKTFIEENCSLSSFVRGSSEDFFYLLGQTDPMVIHREYMSALCPNFILTCGAGPTEIFAPGIHLTKEVEKTATVSTIGAGDNFNAGFIRALVSEDISAGSLRSKGLPESTLERAVTLAHRYSANVCRSLSNYVDNLEI